MPTLACKVPGVRDRVHASETLKVTDIMPPSTTVIMKNEKKRTIQSIKKKFH